MEVYIKIEKNGILIGYLNFPDEEVMSQNMEFLDAMFDSDYIITKCSEEEYDSFEGGDELSIDDIKMGNYTIEDGTDLP